MGILSIQSHVAMGYVGNAAAVFTLQRLGHEVWPIHTLLFSNHPGHGVFGGRLLNPGLNQEILDGLNRQGVFQRCDAVLSGYLGSAAVGPLVLEAVELAGAQNSDSLFVLDPVIGDRETGLFVADEVVVCIRETLVGVADVITPNLFELEVLTGRRVDSEKTLFDAIHRLRSSGPRLVVVTGIERGPGTIGTIMVSDDGCWIVETPALDLGRRANGAGDFFTACFVAHLLEKRNPVAALENAAAAVHAALGYTLESGLAENDLVGSQTRWTNPGQLFTAVQID